MRERRKSVYFDVVQEHGCVALFVDDVELIPAGTTIYSMSAKDKGSEYQRYSDLYDIHFIFDDSSLHVGFYTVPMVEIVAKDGDGGYIGALGRQWDIDCDAPICYIDRNWRCYLLGKNGRDFFEHIAMWKQNMKPFDGIAFYRSREEAEQTLEFVDLEYFMTGMGKGGI